MSSNHRFCGFPVGDQLISSVFSPSFQTFYGGQAVHACADNECLLLGQAYCEIFVKFSQMYLESV